MRRTVSTPNNLAQGARRAASLSYGLGRWCRMSEALMKTPWKKLRASLRERFIWFHLASSASGAERTRRARPNLPSFVRPLARGIGIPLIHIPEKLFLRAFSASSALRRWGSSRSMVNYEQAGKRRGDLLTGDRGHRIRNPRLLEKVCRSGRRLYRNQRSFLGS
jgi:hypothetical protein